MTIRFVVTLESQYVNSNEMTFGLIGKKISHFACASETPLEASIVVERMDDGDYRGDAVTGKKGERFVYFGLEQSGSWLRRWKLRQQQLDVIFTSGVSDPVSVAVLLGKDVTPTIALHS